jgi:peptide/nickel transport system substrate-binding protein
MMSVTWQQADRATADNAGREMCVDATQTPKRDSIGSRALAGLRASGRVRLLALAGAIAAAALLSACGSTTTNSASSTPVTLTTYTPAPKGELANVVWDLPLGEPVPLDPTKDWNPPENEVLAQMCDSLFRINAAMQIVPDLAQSYSHPTPLTWVYNIRPGVKFWDGKPLTAKDVVYSLERQINPSVGSVYLEPVGVMIASVKETGPLQVTLTTHVPNVLVNEMMATGMGVVTEEAFTKAAGSNYGTAQRGVMCTGPFEFKSWTPGQQLVMVRNPDYWDKALEPKVASVTFKWVTDSSTLTDALLTGEIDGTYEAPGSSVSKLRDTSAGHLYVGPATDLAGLVAIGGNTTQETHLLAALSLAIDRSALAKIGYSGAASPIFSSSVFPIHYPEAAPVYQAYNEELKREFGEHKANLQEARRLVAQAGKIAKPLTMVYTAGITTESVIATAIVAEAESVGIPMQAVPLQPAAVTNLYLSPAAREKYDLLLSFQLWTDMTDPLEAMAVNTLAGPTNLSQWTLPPEAMKEFNEANATTDATKRAELTVAVDKVVVKSARYIPLLYTPERMFLGKRVTGPAASWPYAFHYPWTAELGAAG